MDDPFTRLAEFSNFFNYSVFSESCLVVEKSSDETKPCVFPFQVNTTIFDGCTNIDRPSSPPWCSTRVDENGAHISGEDLWGECSDNCKHDNKGRGILSAYGGHLQTREGLEKYVTWSKTLKIYYFSQKQTIFWPTGGPPLTCLESPRTPMCLPKVFTRGSILTTFELSNIFLGLVGSFPGHYLYARAQNQYNSKSIRLQPKPSFYTCYIPIKFKHKAFHLWLIPFSLNNNRHVPISYTIF